MPYFVRLAVLLSLLLTSCTGCGKKFFPSLPTGRAKAQTIRPTLGSPPPATVAAQPVVQQSDAAAQPPEGALGDPALEAPLPADDQLPAKVASGVLFADSFSDLEGSRHWFREGKRTNEGPPRQRTMYFFAGTPEGGPLVMTVLEDDATAGPDGKPGVLSMSWVEWPPKLPWSGFVYAGGGDPGRMTLPPVREARTPDDLRGLRLKFKYRGANASSETPVKFVIECRLEPTLPDSYIKRLALGTITVSDEWQTLEVVLSEAENLDKFLAAIATEKPADFKIVFGQIGAVSNYHPGDTLLIDDIAIVKAPAK